MSQALVLAFTRDQRVDYVLGLMAQGEWYGAKSAKRLAGSWGCTFHTVHEYARCASDVLRLVIKGDPESIKRRIAEGIAAADAIRETALARVKTWTTKDGDEHMSPDPDCRSALQALELSIRLAGAMPAQKLELTLAEMSDEQVEKRFGELIDRLKKETEPPHE